MSSFDVKAGGMYSYLCVLMESHIMYKNSVITPL